MIPSIPAQKGCASGEQPAARPDQRSATWLALTEVRGPDLSRVRAHEALGQLYVGGAHTLPGIESLSQLVELRLLSCSRVQALEPLAARVDLRTLVVATPPGCEASRRCTKVASSAPQRRIRRLETQNSRGVLPLDYGITPLFELSGLRYLNLFQV
jgi:hypothetical protein